MPHPNNKHKNNTNYEYELSTINLGISILLTLLAANFTALVVHVWYFLPHSSELSLFSFGSGVQLCNGNINSTITTTTTDGRIFHRRIRCYLNNKEVTTASQSLQHALSASTLASDEQIVRYDIVPTILDQTRDYYGVVHQLPSIPNRRRMVVPMNNIQHDGYFIPSNAVHNLTYFLEARLRPNEEDRPLYLYNPMVLPLDRNIIGDNILSDLSINDNLGDVAYIAVFRISNFGNCHGPGKGVPDTYRNYIGLALLDYDLNIIQDPISGEYLDVVIDLNEHLFDVKWSPWIGRGGRRPTKVKQYMQDCQLIAAPSKEGAMKKADTLVLICNEYAMHVRLQHTTSAIKEKKKDTPLVNEKEKDFVHLKNTYGSGLQLTALERPNVIIMKGKNLHYFQAALDSSSKRGPGFLEIWPGGPHEVLHMDFINYPFANVRPNAKPEDTPNVTIKATQSEEPIPSFATIDSKSNGASLGPLISRDSGSACCVPVLWKDSSNNVRQRRLLLGFSHRKTRRTVRKEEQYNYVSRVYAFEPFPPFNIVARSGLFCLGFALSPEGIKSKVSDEMIFSHLDEEARQSDNEQVHGAANDHKLKINGKTFDCPRIHFITGIADKMGDNEKVIISYGVNDCYPRMIEVSKSFLVSLLKPS